MVILILCIEVMLPSLLLNTFKPLPYWLLLTTLISHRVGSQEQISIIIATISLTA